MQRAFLSFLLLCALFFAPVLARAQMATPSPADQLFKERPFGPRPEPTGTPTPKFVAPESDFEIPIGGWIALGLVGLLALAGLYYGSVRRWHSSNLFDRQYHFPVVHDPALRFGAKKSGGHLARLELGSLVRQNGSETKDA